jgi:hypothetical protein
MHFEPDADSPVLPGLRQSVNGMKIMLGLRIYNTGGVI